MKGKLPRILIIDDLFGRDLDDGLNRERRDLCASLHLNDVTGDRTSSFNPQVIANPVAEVVFCRGQKPVRAMIGDRVENDLSSVLDSIASGWIGQDPWPPAASESRLWSMALIDLSFKTGEVTESSHRRMPGMPVGRREDDQPKSYFGLSLLGEIHDKYPELPIFILSAMERKDVSREFSERGALGFINKNDTNASDQIKGALDEYGLIPDATGVIIGNSPKILQALVEARAAGRHRRNVLIRGERGTGKELLARYVHLMRQPWREAPFVIINSPVFTSELFASELFGIEPRTASDVEGRKGLIEQGNGGDVFFDEIADMPGFAQASILRVLQERNITPVGGRNPLDLDIRFISSTNRDVEAEPSKFRPDLLSRLLEGGRIRLPALSERKSDIPLLAYYFIREAEQSVVGSRPREIDHAAARALMEYSWPGNVRELKQVLYYAVLKHKHLEHLTVNHLENLDKDQSKVSLSFVEKKEAIDQCQAQRKFDLSEWTKYPEKAEYSADKYREWAGRLDEVSKACTEIQLRMLKAAVLATLKRSARCPEGKIQILSAIKLLTGDESMKAPRAADIIKRMMKTPVRKMSNCPTANDPLIQEVFKLAVKKRRSRSKK